jgi:hypothetical protein
MSEVEKSSSGEIFFGNYFSRGVGAYKKYLTKTST